ncbi:hypothetical protein KEM09_21340 [Carboxylicivirga mesophila]|uniref:PsbP C-terminal domain-containing protein n=1 Tax=Carboxylicivirga mesophila TaxID=1166478 RepID=A0ABS5KGT9_9BACT|nr:hypothetical protein [Carboxylicivirga mesophila]MBS2213967.1 hypothetical protein [Carboxylicivirga mesophila]
MRKLLAINILISLLVAVSSCKNEEDQINGMCINNDIFTHTTNDIIAYSKVFIDKNNRFSIELPKDWMYAENIIDSVKGVVASDTTINFHQNGIVNVCEYKTHFTSLREYFAAEIENLDTDNHFNIIQIGKARINGLESFWTLYEEVKDTTSNMIENHKSLIYYVQRNKSDTFYLLETTVYDIENYQEKLRELRPILETFKIRVEPNKN